MTEEAVVQVRLESEDFQRLVEQLKSLILEADEKIAELKKLLNKEN